MLTFHKTERKYLHYFPWSLFPSSEINFCNVYHQRSEEKKNLTQVWRVILFTCIISGTLKDLKKKFNASLKSYIFHMYHFSYSPLPGKKTLFYNSALQSRDRLSAWSRKQKLVWRRTEMSNNFFLLSHCFPRTLLFSAKLWHICPEPNS